MVFRSSAAGPFGRTVTGASSPRRAAVVLLAIATICCNRRRHEPVAPVRFVDVTEAAGIARTTPTYDAAVGDFDGDGRPDLYVGNHGTGAVLLRNTGDRRFADVLPGAGIDPLGDQHGAGWADYDNDGRLDLVVGVGAGRGLQVKQNRLYHNDGAGRFHDVGATSGVADPRGRSRAVAWLDIDNDGWLDLVLANFASPNRLFRNRHDGAFEDLSDSSGLSALAATRVAWGDYDGDGYADLLLSGTPRGMRLLHNEAGRRFTDVTELAGLAARGQPAQGMAFGDADNDGDLDLYVSFGGDFHDVVREDAAGRITFAFFAQEAPIGFDFETAGPDVSGIDAELYENGVPVAAQWVTCGASTPPASRTVHCAGADAASATMPGGDLGFALWRDLAGQHRCPSCPETFRWHLRWRGAGDHHLSGIVTGGTGPSPVALKRPPKTGGALWRNEGNGSFTPWRLTTLQHTANGQAVQWADVNNDGWLDLYVVDSGEDGGNGTNRLFLNDQGRDFVAADAASGAAPSSGAGRGAGAHFFDLDGDGRLDLFVTNGWGAPPFDRGPYRLLRNVSAAGHWLALDLQGTRCNRQALGAWITLTACGGSQARYHNGGASYFSQAAALPHFGLGECTAVSTLRVRWPSGITQEWRDVPMDRVWRAVEGQ